MESSYNIRGVLGSPFVCCCESLLTVIEEHLLCCNYCPSFQDFSILTRESNDIKLKIMESLLTARDKPILNKADSSLPSELF